MNKEEAIKKNEFFSNGLDEAIEYLEDCKKRGENVYIDFNGHLLYSADITVDGAYLEVVGMTKKEDESIREQMNNAKTQEERANLIKEWGNIKKRHEDEAKKRELNEMMNDASQEKTDEKSKISNL